MPYLLRYGDIEFGSHFEKWPSPRYAQFLKCPPSRILKPYVYITQINSQTSIPPKCLRAYRAGPGLKEVRVKQRTTPWMSSEILNLIRQKDKYLRTFRRSKDQLDYNLFVYHKYQVKYKNQKRNLSIMYTL